MVYNLPVGRIGVLDPTNVTVTALAQRTFGATESLPPNLTPAPTPKPPPPHGNKGAAAPGDTFPTETTITAQNAGNAAKLDGLGFVAAPQTAWTFGQKITILPSYHFYWDGSAWQPGGAPLVATAAAGTPGTITPAAPTAQDFDGGTITATPGTAWTTGQYVATTSGAERFWDGNTWQTGKAP